MTDLTPPQLLAVANAIANAYGPGPAEILFASINEDFDLLTDSSQPHPSRMCDAVADLTARARLFDLVFAALNGPARGNLALKVALQPVTMEARWRQLATAGLVLRLGPFVNRSHLRSEIERLFLSRRLLRISGTVRGRTWSCQMLERHATLHGARYVHADLRKAPAEGRTDPKWLATTLHAGLFKPPAAPPSLQGFAENRLVEPLLSAWVPPGGLILVAIDHLGDTNVAAPVHDYVASLALAVAEEKVPGIRLVLIDGPPGLDLSDYSLQTADDVVEQVTSAHLQAFFDEAAQALYPNLTAAQLKPITDAVAHPVAPLASAGMSKSLALAVRDALETMAMG